jgi:hypothetical protein
MNFSYQSRRLFYLGLIKNDHLYHRRNIDALEKFFFIRFFFEVNRWLFEGNLFSFNAAISSNAELLKAQSCVLGILHILL